MVSFTKSPKKRKHKNVVKTVLFHYDNRLVTAVKRINLTPVM